MGVFKANDIRGLYPDDWNRETAYRIGQSLPGIFEGKNIVIGRDGRTSSEEILFFLKRGLREKGIRITDIGQVDTPAVYFAIGNYKFDGGIMITASHNPPGYNGLKLSGRDAVPIEYTSGIRELEDLVRESDGHVRDRSDRTDREKHPVLRRDISEDYLSYLADFCPDRRGGGKPLKAVFDCSNGMASVFIRGILKNFPGETVILNDIVDGTFPVHGPNPAQPENLEEIRSRVLAEQADIGFCFDGDGDRVVMVDRTGRIISPDLITAVLGLYYFRNRSSGPTESKTVLVDIRSSNSIRDFLQDLGARVVVCPVGHARIKKMMREENALFAGELTGHYYFRENFYCDSAWLTIFRILSVLLEGETDLAGLSREIMRYHYSGERNYRLTDKDGVIETLKERYADAAVNTMDGVRFDYPDWWFIIRKSGTEPLLRLVAEAGTAEDLEQRIEDIEGIITEAGGYPDE